MLNQPVGGDEALLLVYADQVAAGRIPNLDFFTSYGPGTYRVLEALFAWNGPSILVERIYGVSLHVAVVLGLMVLLRAWGRLPSVVGGVAATAVLLWFTPVAYPWFTGLALYIWSAATLVSARRSGSKTRRTSLLVLAGVLAGLVPYFRPEMTVLLLGLLPLLRKGLLARFVVGLTIGLIPLLAHLALAGAPLLDNVFTSRMFVNGQTTLSTVDPHVWVLIASCVVGVGFLFWRSWTADTHRAECLSLALVGLLILPQSLQRTDIFHAVFVAAFVVPSALAVLVATYESRVRLTARFDAPFIRVAAVLVAIGVGTVSLLQPQPATQAVTNSGRTVLLSQADATRIKETVASLHENVPVGSRIFVGAGDLAAPGTAESALYLLLPEYRADSYFLEIANGIAQRRGSAMESDIQQADVLVLTEISPAVIAIDLPHLTRGDTQAARYVADQFRVLKTIGPTQILVRNS